jgi:sugar phosphate isomerase/epimerase
MENDNPDSEDPFRVVRIIETVNSPFLRALPDFCNSRQLGDEQYNYRALEALFPHAFNISHVKDLEMVQGAPMRVDMGRIFAIARGAGYHGYFSMEFEGEGDPYEGTKRLIEASLGSLS